MNNLLEYKGYHSTIEFSSEDNILVGKVCWISDNLTFEGTTIDEIEIAFHETIDEYLDLCTQIGKTPEKEFKGSLNVRMHPDLHRTATLYAAQKGITLNQFISDAISASIEGAHARDIANIVVSTLSSRSIGVVSQSLPFQAPSPYQQGETRLSSIKH